MKRVLLLSFPYASALGGGERYAEQVVEGLAPKGFGFSLISSSRALLDVFRKRGWEARARWGGFEPVTELHAMLFLFTLPFALTRIAFWLRQHRKSGGNTVVCLSLTDKLLATPIAHRMGLRVVWMEHLVPGRALRLNPFLIFYKMWSPYANIVCVSEDVARSLATLGILRNRMRIIPPGIKMSAKRAVASSPVIGCVARLSKEKGVDLLLYAFARVPEAKLEIFGDGPERGALETLAAELSIADRVRFRGYVVGAEERYGHLSVLAVPSRKESFGIAALEAMGWGVPVVASRIEGLPELVIDGQTGILCACADAKAWSDALVRLLTDKELARRLGEAGRARAAQFTLDKNVAAWQELLR